jgi:hypothetical protein
VTRAIDTAALLLCPICNTSAGRDVRAGIGHALLPLLAMALVLAVLASFAVWMQRRGRLTFSSSSSRPARRRR